MLINKKLFEKPEYINNLKHYFTDNDLISDETVTTTKVINCNDYTGDETVATTQGMQPSIRQPIVLINRIRMNKNWSNLYESTFPEKSYHHYSGIL